MNLLGVVLILAAVGGTIYFAVTLVQDIRQRRKDKPKTDKK